MRRVLLLGALLAAPAAALAAPDGREATSVICHRTGSLERPYARVRVNARLLRVHRKHSADIIPAAARCPRNVLTPFHGGTGFSAAFSGEPGRDPVATGRASVVVRRGQGQACAVFEVDDLSAKPSVGVHLHRVAGVPETVAFFRGLGVNERSTSSCARIDRRDVAHILRRPGDFEVDIHTSDFPDGAVRARLGSPPAQVRRAMTMRLAGDSVCSASACGVGDADGFAFAAVLLRPLVSAGLVCYRLELAPTVSQQPLAAHIHRGGVGEAGPVVVTLDPPLNRRSMGCATTSWQVHDEILLNPSRFYVDVHDAEFPDGAVRAQLPARNG